MTSIDSASSPPERLLLATDLSPRCDRALDRSVQLAKSWQAELKVLNVVDAPKAPDQILAWATGDEAQDPRLEALAQINQDLAHLQIEANVALIRSGNVAETIRRVAHDSKAGLVVTGVARDEPFGRFLLGSSVERLARTLERPLLIVRNRTYGAYRRIAVASDLSAGSRTALQAATRWFAGSDVALFHARAQPKGLASAPSGADPRPASAADQELCAQFVVDSGIPPADVTQVVAVEGALESTLTQYVRRHAVDLVVMGPHESAGFLDALMGSSLDRLLQWVPCDVLVVPGGSVSE